MRRLAVLVAGLTAVLSGCVALPQAGPVHTEAVQEQLEVEAPVDFTPAGPEPGAPPVEIVRGFLVAMQATPLNTSVARRFLTAESRSSWVPERGTVVYAAETRTARGDDVVLDLADTVALDERGEWLGDRGDVRYRLDLVRERGQWRIADPPDRMLIPLTHFQTRFEQSFLYFFDKSGQVLVPEPVHVPTGPQATTFLMTGLLHGPARHLLGVERTFIPAGTRLDDLSVPVSARGVAQVPLSDEVLDLSSEQLELALAQISWTLSQVPGVERVQVTVDGSPLNLPGIGSEVGDPAFSEYDPAVTWASSSLFGIRDGRVVTFVAGKERRVSGVFGSLDLDPVSLAVDLPGERVAVTTAAGSVLTGARSRDPGLVPRVADAEQVLAGGTELLPPGWDLHGHLWIVDRTDAGAALWLAEPGAPAHPVDAPGLTRRDVVAFAVSRDGTRLVAALRGEARDRLVVARVRRDAEGRVRGLAPAVPVPLKGLSLRRLTDVGWRTPGGLAVLGGAGEGEARVLLVRLDGSSTPAESALGPVLSADAARVLVSAPSPLTSLYVLGGGSRRLLALSATGRWVGTGIEPGLRAAAYVG